MLSVEKLMGLLKLMIKNLSLKLKIEKNIFFNTIPINDKINIKQLDNYIDDDLWNNIILKLIQYALLITKLQENLDWL